MLRLRDATLDLFLGATCVGCAAPGRVLCLACRAGLPGGAGAHPPSPCPPGLAPAYAVAAYADVLRALVLGHKEHRLLALTPVLGRLLAQAVAVALDERLGAAAACHRVVLVPVPSRAAAVRARGHDPTRAMVEAAARELGASVEVARLLRTRRGVVDQAGLDVESRRANLAGSIAARPGALRALGRRAEPVHLVVCDDVLTTGSTAREAQRALEALGLPVLAVATVAATPRRLHGVSSATEVPSHEDTH